MFQPVCGNIEQRLVGLHQVAVKIRIDVKKGHNLIKHLPMLAGNTDLHFKSAGLFF
jgi:hypothetical protein